MKAVASLPLKQLYWILSKSEACMICKDTSLGTEEQTTKQEAVSIQILPCTEAFLVYEHVNAWLQDKLLSKIHHSTSLLGSSCLWAVNHPASCVREAEATQTHTHSLRNHRVITHINQHHAIVICCIFVFWHTQG